MLTPDRYQEAIVARRQLSVASLPDAQRKEMTTLEDVGWNGDYVSPIQMSSRSFGGPIIVLNNWYGWQALLDLPSRDPDSEQQVRKLGYLPGIRTNIYLDEALSLAGLQRSEVYITQACALLPKEVTGGAIPNSVLQASARAVLPLEASGRTCLALGGKAKLACRIAGVPFLESAHPSFQSGRFVPEIVELLKELTT